MELSSISATLPRPKEAALFVLLLLLVTVSEASISSSDVIKDLRSCLNSLVTGSGKPPAACCSGASALASGRRPRQIRRLLERVSKSSAKSINYKLELAKVLPQNCGISLPFTISPNIDCSKIS